MAILAVAHLIALQEGMKAIKVAVTSSLPLPSVIRAHWKPQSVGCKYRGNSDPVTASHILFP